MCYLVVRPSWRTLPNLKHAHSMMDSTHLRLSYTAVPAVISLGYERTSLLDNRCIS
jgi:hypothetical protein